MTHSCPPPSSSSATGLKPLAGPGVAENGVASKSRLWGKRYTVTPVASANTKRILTEIARGSEKIVYQPLENGDNGNTPEAKSIKDRNVVIYAPVTRFHGLYSKESSLKKEYDKAGEIKRSVQDASHLAVNMELLTGKERVDGQFSMAVEKASCDLEARLQDQSVTFAQRMDYCAQYLDGLANLHGADMVHGDIKPENCLFYDDDQSNGTLKISDFGKAKKLPDGKTATYTGNLRFCPPEGVLSQKGDVYGSALLIIRVLEETPGILNGQDSLLAIGEEDREPGVTSTGRGIDKFVVEHKTFPALDSQNLTGKITKRLPRQIKLAHHSKHQREEQVKLVHSYIEKLTDRLNDQGHLTSLEAKKLTAFLKSMTQENPVDRLTAKSALDRLTTLCKDKSMHESINRNSPTGS